MDASVVAFGAWAIGGWKWGGADATNSIAAVQASLDAGVDFIDTAAVYGFGLSEEIVGKAIQKHPIFIGPNDELRMRYHRFRAGLRTLAARHYIRVNLL